VGTHLVYENQRASIELPSYQNPPGSPQERVALARLYTPFLRICSIRLSSRHAVESLTDIPVSASKYSPLSKSVTKGRSSRSADRSLLALSSSWGFEPGLFFGARDLPRSPLWRSV
jgi:hypothetical protein